MNIARTATGLEGAILIDANGAVVISSGGGGGSTSVWSAADAAATGMTLSNGGLTVTGNPAGWNTIRTNGAKSSGKVYVEFLLNTVPPDGLTIFGVADNTASATTYLGSTGNSIGFNTNNTHGASGSMNVPGPAFPATLVQNDVWAYAVDFDAGYFWIAHNNVWLDSGNPVTGANPMGTWVSLSLFPALSLNAAGVWTLQSTAVSQKYAPPSGFVAWDSAAPTNSPQALAYLARTVGGNEGGNGANIATLIDGLVSDGVWAKLDALYVLAQQNQSDALLNLVGTNYGLVGINANTLSFTSYVGFGNFATTNTGLDTGFNAVTATSPHYTANNASYGVWSYAVVNENVAVMGNGATGASDSIMYPSFPPTSFYARVNDNTATYVNAPGAKGLFVGDRPSSAVVNPYWNGLSQGTLASTSQGVTNATFTIGQSQGYLGQDDPAPRAGTAQTLSAAFIGASLGAAGQLALYNRLRTYMTAVGVP